MCGAHQFRDLPDVSEVVHGPLVEHLLQRDFARLLVHGAALAGGAWQRPQKVHVGVALLLELVETVDTGVTIRTPQ